MIAITKIDEMLDKLQNIRRVLRNLHQDVETLGQTGVGSQEANEVNMDTIRRIYDELSALDWNLAGIRLHKLNEARQKE